MNRTIRLPLYPADEQAAILVETSRQFTESFNHVCEYGWKNNERNGVKLHHATYYPLREKYPDLLADHHCQARGRATEALKSVFALKRKGRKVSQPRSSACPIRYRDQTLKLDWEEATIRLGTIEGRITIPFSLPDYALKHAGSKFLTADLIHRDGRWWLHVSVDVSPPKVAPSDDMMGVDLGVARAAVTSKNSFHGKKSWRRVEERNLRLRRALQAKRTKSAKRHLKKMRRRQERFRRDCDHVTAKEVVDAVEPGGTIVVENLKGIHSRTKARRGGQSRRLHGWAFAQLLSFITYKAEDRGVTVVSVDPRHTSQTCSACGHCARNNRRSQSVFKCRECGFELNADLNAARNIAAKYRTDSGMTGADGLPTDQPIVGNRA